MKMKHRRPARRDPLDLPYGADPLDGPGDAGRRPTPPKVKSRHRKKAAKSGALAKAQAYEKPHAP